MSFSRTGIKVWETKNWFGFSVVSLCDERYFVGSRIYVLCLRMSVVKSKEIYQKLLKCDEKVKNLNF